MLQTVSPLILKLSLFLITAVATHLVMSFGQTLLHYKVAHRPALPPAGRYHDVDFQMQLRNCPPWVERPLRYTGDLARNFSGAAFLPMAAASCRLRKSVAAHLFWPCIECRGSARVRCTQFRQRTRQPTTFASMGSPVSSLAKHRPSINTGNE